MSKEYDNAQVEDEEDNTIEETEDGEDTDGNVLKPDNGMYTVGPGLMKIKYGWQLIRSL